MRRLRNASFGLLGTVVLFAWIASPVAASTIFTLDGGPKAFDVDPDGPGGASAVSFDITAAGFDLDLGTRELKDLVVIGDDGTTVASLSLNAPVFLTPSLQLISAAATLTLGASSSTIQLVDGFFIDQGGSITFQFFGGGIGSAGPPDLDLLVFTASANGGQLPSTTPIPEPSGLVLFAAGLLVVAFSLREKSA